jgi:hypothetical protein
MDTIQKDGIDLVEYVIGTIWILEDGLNIFPIFLSFLMRVDVVLFPLEENLALGDADQTQYYFG